MDINNSNSNNVAISALNQVTDIIRAIDADHNDDFSKSVEPLKRELIMIFRVDSASYGRNSERT